MKKESVFAVYGSPRAPPGLTRRHCAAAAATPSGRPPALRRRPARLALRRASPRRWDNIFYKGLRMIYRPRTDGCMCKKQTNKQVNTHTITRIRTYVVIQKDNSGCLMQRPRFSALQSAPEQRFRSTCLRKPPARAPPGVPSGPSSEVDAGRTMPASCPGSAPAVYTRACTFKCKLKNTIMVKRAPMEV